MNALRVHVRRNPSRAVQARTHSCTRLIRMGRAPGFAALVQEHDARALSTCTKFSSLYPCTPFGQGSRRSPVPLCLSTSPNRLCSSAFVSSFSSLSSLTPLSSSFGLALSASNSLSPTIAPSSAHSVSFSTATSTDSNANSLSVAGKMTLEGLKDKISLKGVPVLLRADLNVPLSKKEEGVSIADDARIRAALPTLQFLVDQGAKVIMCSHLGRPNGKVIDRLRMDPIAERLSQLLGRPIQKVDECVGEEVDEAVSEMKDGDIILLENLRFYPGETKNSNDFAQDLAKHAKVFVNDAFGAAHRAHASTVGVTSYTDYSVAGFLLERELRYLCAAINEPQRPLAAVLGGAKVSTKLKVLHSLLNKVDKLLIGGGMVFTFIKAQGHGVGKSVVEEDMVELAASILEKAKAEGVELVLAKDVVVAEAFDPSASSKLVSATDIPENVFGMDIGPETVDEFKKQLSTCKTVVWNGPMGVFEFEKFAQGTIDMAKILVELTEKGVETIVGGGDSSLALDEADMTGKVSHVSTGGGSSLELLEGKTLPAVAALDDAEAE